MPTSAPAATFAAPWQLSQLSPVLMCLSELNTSAAKSTCAANTLRRSNDNSNPNIFANILLFLSIFIHLYLGLRSASCPVPLPELNKRYISLYLDLEIRAETQILGPWLAFAGSLTDPFGTPPGCIWSRQRYRDQTCAMLILVSGGAYRVPRLMIFRSFGWPFSIWTMLTSLRPSPFGVKEKVPWAPLYPRVARMA